MIAATATATLPTDATAHCAPLGLLLAAGRGERFDPHGRDNKLLAQLPAGEIVVVAAARQMLAVLPVLAVVSSLDGEVAQRLAALGCDVVACAPGGGMI